MCKIVPSKRALKGRGLGTKTRNQGTWIPSHKTPSRMSASSDAAERVRGKPSTGPVSPTAASPAVNSSLARAAALPFLPRLLRERRRLIAFVVDRSEATEESREAGTEAGAEARVAGRETRSVLLSEAVSVSSSDSSHHEALVSLVGSLANGSNSWAAGFSMASMASGGVSRAVHRRDLGGFHDMSRC